MLQPAAYSWEGDDGDTAKKIFSIAFLIIHIDQVTNKMPMWHYLYLPKLQQNNKHPMLYSYMKNNQL